MSGFGPNSFVDEHPGRRICSVCKNSRRAAAYSPEICRGRGKIDPLRQPRLREFAGTWKWDCARRCQCGETETPLVCFVGTSGVGKTTLLARVVPSLKRLGLRVATIKHTHHHTFEIDQEGKDSRRLAEAGSDVVVLSSYGKTTLIRHWDEGLALDGLALMLENEVDIILVEGYKNADAAKVLVHRSSASSNLPSENHRLLAIVSDQRLAMDIPQFTFDEVDPLVHFLIAYAHCADTKGRPATSHSAQLSPTRD